MLQSIFTIVIALSICKWISSLFKKKPAEGKPNTKAQQKVIDSQMKEFLESNPNNSFFDDNPSYKEKYLGEIDLSELDLEK